MAHFSRLQITLHWLTLLLTGIAYAAIELRGWAPKGSSVYLFMKDMPVSYTRLRAHETHDNRGCG
ncbi:hypothetical protein C9F07_29975, partial [Salmonella enterica subsp. enterica serovar Poona]